MATQPTDKTGGGKERSGTRPTKSDKEIKKKNE